MKIEEKYGEVGIMAKELRYIRSHNKNIEYTIKNGLPDNRLRFLFVEASLTVMLLERLCRIYVMEKNNQDRVDKTLGPLLKEIRDDGLISNDTRKALLGFRNTYYHGNFEQLVDAWNRCDDVDLQSKEQYFKELYLNDIENCFKIVNELAWKLKMVLTL